MEALSRLGAHRKVGRRPSWKARVISLTPLRAPECGEARPLCVDPMRRANWIEGRPGFSFACRREHVINEISRFDPRTGVDLLAFIQEKVSVMAGKTALEMDPAEWRQYRPFRAGKAAPPPSAQTEEARRVASALARELRSRFGAERVILFGSLARGEFSGRSDIDLAVWGIPPREFYRAVAFASGFSKVWAVDLVDAEDCSELLKGSIVREGVAL